MSKTNVAWFSWAFLHNFILVNVFWTGPYFFLFLYFSCWLSRIPFYAAFLGPVALLIIVNSVVFVFVMRQIINRSSNKLTKTEVSSTKVRLRGAISVIVLLGLTWIFAIFAVGDFGIIFHYLFAILNSLQGLFIFIFYCFLKNDVRNLWRRKFSCLKSPYETDSGTKSNDRGNLFVLYIFLIQMYKIALL